MAKRRKANEIEVDTTPSNVVFREAIHDNLNHLESYYGQTNKGLYDSLEELNTSMEVKEAIISKLRGEKAILEKKLVEAGCQAEREVQAFVEDAMGSSTNFVIQARIRMDAEVDDPSFDRKTSDMATWKMLLEVMTEQDRAEEELKADTAADTAMVVAKAGKEGKVTTGDEGNMQVGSRF